MISIAIFSKLKLGMSARNFFRLILFIIFASLVGASFGVVIYYFTPYKQIINQQVSVPVKQPTTVCPSVEPLEQDLIRIKQSDSLVSYLLYLTFEGVLNSKEGNEWKIAGKDGNFTFRLSSQAEVEKVEIVDDESSREKIDPEEIPVNGLLRVTVAVVDVFAKEIDGGNLTNHNTVSINYYPSGVTD